MFCVCACVVTLALIAGVLCDTWVVHGRVWESRCVGAWVMLGAGDRGIHGK